MIRNLVAGVCLGVASTIGVEVSWVRRRRLENHIPELWAKASLEVLRNNLVMAKLVHRDFEEKQG